LLAADAPADAEPHLRRALELDAEHEAARRLLAHVLVDRRRYEEAVPLLRSLLADHPEDGALHAQLTEALHVLGELTDAEAAYEAWLAVDGRSDEALFGLGQVLYDQGRYEDAVRAFRKAEKRRSGRADVRSELGLALQALGRLPDAEAKQRDALERDPRNAEAWFRLGDVVSRQGDARRAEAVDAMRQAVRLDPRHVHAQLFLYRLLRQGVLAGDTDLDAEAQRRWRSVLRFHGPRQLGRRAGAPRLPDAGGKRIRRLRERLQEAPDDHDARRELAGRLHAEGALDEALVEYEALLEAGVDDSALQAAAGGAALGTQRSVRAIELLEPAARADDGPVSARRHLAWALLLADRADDARHVYASLVAAAPDDVLAHCGHGLALMRLDRLDEGLREIAEAGWLK
jgi:tetratricopeptide (TPR) repeat protein